MEDSEGTSASSPYSVSRWCADPSEACDSCYRSKVKCEGKENPPCDRCRKLEILCGFDGRKKSKLARVEERLDAIEQAMATFTEHTTFLQLQMQQLLRGPLISPQSHPPLNDARIDTSVTATSAPYAGPVERFEAEVLSGQSALVTSVIKDGIAREPEEDDPLVSVGRMAPFGRIHDGQAALAGSVDAIATGDDMDGNRPYKRRRAGNTFFRIYGLRDVSLENELVDPVEAGLCSALESQHLLSKYFLSCHMSLPVLDPRLDTWESLRSRSPFLFTVILLITKTIDDGSAPPSQLQIQSKARVRALVGHTLHGDSQAVPVISIESIQAICILSAFGDWGWRMGGHAMRLSMEASLYKCLPRIVQHDQASGVADVDAQQALVIGARIWLCVCKMEYEMAYNHGQPLLISEDKSIELGRALLRQPTSQLGDSRLVASCELLRARSRRHLTFDGVTHPPDVTAEAVSQENAVIEDWYRRWNEYYDQIAVPMGDYLREILTSSKWHALLVTNSRLLVGLNTSADFDSLPPASRLSFDIALTAASTLVNMAVNGGSYSRNFLESNTLTHVGMVFAARLLIRLASLGPVGGHRRMIGKDLQLLAQTLTKVPRKALADRVQLVLDRARAYSVIPARSRLPSPFPTSTTDHPADLERVAVSSDLAAQSQLFEELFPGLFDQDDWLHPQDPSAENSFPGIINPR